MSDTDFRNNTFYSPIAPLQQHMQRVYEAVLYLPDVFAALIAEDWQVVETTQEKIVHAVHASDGVLGELRQHLPRGLYMPSERRDVLDLLVLQEHIARQAREIAGLILSRKMELPADMSVAILGFGQSCVDCVSAAFTAIKEFNQMIEPGSGSVAYQRVGQELESLDTTRRQAEKQLHDLRNSLFEHEQEMSPIDVMFTYRIFDAMGQIADDAHRVTSRAGLMLAR